MEKYLSKYPIYPKIKPLIEEPLEYPFVSMKDNIILVYHNDGQKLIEVLKLWPNSTLFLTNKEEKVEKGKIVNTKDFEVLFRLSDFGSWNELFSRIDLTDISRNVYSEQSITVFPPFFDVFRIFEMLPIEKIKVIFIFQDPYAHEHSCGIAISSNQSSIPPTLKTLIDVLKKEGFTHNSQREKPGDLTHWVNQGVFLFNAALTVGKNRSHQDYWKGFSQSICSQFNKSNLVVCLFGACAKELEPYMKKAKVLKFAHPSPRSQISFDNVEIFTKVNTLLKDMKIQEIDWNLV